MEMFCITTALTLSLLQLNRYRKEQPELSTMLLEVHVTKHMYKELGWRSMHERKDIRSFYLFNKPYMISPYNT